CLQKDPNKRYASAEALAEDLQRFLAGEPIVARPPSLGKVAWKWTRRHPALATLLACSVLVAGALLGLLLWHQASENERHAHLALVAADERERLGQLHGKVRSLLRSGEEAIASGDWRSAQVQLTRAREQARDRPELADLRADVEQLLQQTH